MNIENSIKYISDTVITTKAQVFLSILSSFSISVVLDKLVEHISGKDITMAITMLLTFTGISSIFIMLDLITGIIASRHEGEKISSKKWGTTVSKFFGLYLYLLIACILVLIVPVNTLTYALILGPIVLTIFKEFISIGENFNRRFGKQAYIFSVFNKIFDIFEKLFFKTLNKKLDSTVENITPKKTEEQ